MTQPPQWGPYPPPSSGVMPPKPERSSGAVVADIAAGAIGWAILVVVAGGSVFISLFFAMETDSCSTKDNPCDTDMVGVAMLIAWVGCGLSILIAMVGSIVCVVKHTFFFYWPYIGTATCVVTMFFAFEALDAVRP